MNLKHFHRTIKVRIVETLFSKFAGDVINIFMPIYFAIHFGAAVAGIFLAFNFLLANLAGFYSGYYTDIVGRKKLLVISESIRLIGLLVIAFCNSPWFESSTVTFATLVIVSICYGLTAPASESLIIDVTLPEQRDFIYSLFYWIRNIAYTIGGVVGGIMFKNHLFELFIILSVSAMISTTLISFFVKEEFAKKKEFTHSPAIFKELILNYKFVLKNKIFRIYLMAVFFGFTLEHQLANYVAVRLEKDITSQSLFSFGNKHLIVDGINLLGILRAENSLFVIILAIFIMKIINKINSKSSIYIGVMIYAIGMTVLAISNEPLILIIMMLVISIGELMSFPLMDSQLAWIAPEEYRSSYIAVREVTLQTGIIFSALGITMGAWVSSYVMGGLFLFMGIISIISFKSVFSYKEGIYELGANIEN